MRVRDLLPFIDEQQEMVIRTSEGGKTVGGTAYEIKYNQKKCQELLDADIVCVYNHCWKMYIIVEFQKAMKVKCESMK